MVFTPNDRTELKTAVDAFFGPSPTLTSTSTVTAGQGSGTYGVINTWDTSNVTQMNNLFLNMTSFNEDIGDWDVCEVTNFTGMFNGASSFNRYIGDWCPSGHCFDTLNSMHAMFKDATSFDQDISGWNVSNIDNYSDMFVGATAFDEDLRPWGNQGTGPKSTATYDDMFTGATAFISLYGSAGYNLNYFGTTPSYLFFDVSNTCFPAGTLVSLDQGDVEIQKIDIHKHTLNGDSIIAVVRTTPSTKSVIRFEKDVFAPNCPSQAFECSKNHEIIAPSGQRQTAHQWAEWAKEEFNGEKITLVPNTYEDLYNVLLKTHQTMVVYNLEVETLHPGRQVAHKAISRKQQEDAKEGKELNVIV